MAGKNINYSQPYLSSNTFSTFFLMVALLVWEFSSHKSTDQYSAKNHRRIPLLLTCFLSCLLPLSLLPPSPHSYILWGTLTYKLLIARPPQTQSLSPQLTETTWCVWVPPPRAMVWKLALGSELVQSESPPCLFAFSWECSSCCFFSNAKTAVPCILSRFFS